MEGTVNKAVASQILRWTLVDEAGIDISFLERQHRRRLSRTTQLALTAYHLCNPEKAPVRTVFASRYGEYVRTYSILEDIARGESASPAAFSVSVHNTPSGIAGIATANPAPSSTVAANSATVEAGFLEAVTQFADRNDDDLIFVFVDEPLPDLYQSFKGAKDQAYAIGLRLTHQSARAPQARTPQARILELSWRAQQIEPVRGPDGIPQSGREIVRLLNAGSGTWSSQDGRLSWEWSVD